MDMGLKYAELGVVDFTDCLSIEEAATKARVSVMTIRKWVLKSKVESVRVGRITMVRKDSLNEHITARRNQFLKEHLDQAAG
jgi:excisionase family DNA binding protein